ncbi:hypothetical protein [Nostoc sp.]|uniref:hypothetical protein n=1 Tax=Nostoc sp. TaxID=1180 RepID=UPI002FFC10EE
MSNGHISISATVAAILWFQSRQSYPSTDICCVKLTIKMHDHISPGGKWMISNPH